jgi:hypothetical protein
MVLGLLHGARAGSELVSVPVPVFWAAAWLAKELAWAGARSKRAPEVFEVFVAA